jgi:hypothetical protein
MRWPFVFDFAGRAHAEYRPNPARRRERRSGTPTSRARPLLVLLPQRVGRSNRRAGCAGPRAAYIPHYRIAGPAAIPGGHFFCRDPDRARVGVLDGERNTPRPQLSDARRRQPGSLCRQHWSQPVQDRPVEERLFGNCLRTSNSVVGQCLERARADAESSRFRSRGVGDDGSIPCAVVSGRRHSMSLVR